MNPPQEQEPAPPESRVPRGAWQLMALILVAMALLAVYSNVQKARRAQIETVTITPTSSPALTPAPSPPATAP